MVRLVNAGRDPNVPTPKVVPWLRTHRAGELASKIFHASRDGQAVVCVRDRRIVDVNESWCHATGFTYDESLGRRLRDLRVAETAGAARLEALALADDGVRELPVTFVDAAGERRRFVVSTEHVDIDGVRYALVTGHDVTDEERLTESLRVTRESFERLFRRSPIPSYLWRRRGDDLVLTDFNDATVELTKGGIAAMVGITARELFASDPEILANFEESLRTGELVHDCYPYQMKSTGEPKFLDVTMFSVPPDLVVVQTADETEEFLLNAAITDSERRYRMLFEEASDGIVVVDAQAHVTDINRKGCEVLGYTRDELLGEPLSRLRPASSEEPLILPTLRPGEERNLDRTVLRRDGTTLMIEASARKMADSTTIIMFRDVSDRRRSEEALRASEERFRGLVENAPDVVFEVNDQGLILSLNPAFEQLTGWTCAEWTGRPYAELLHESSRDRAAAVMEENLRAGSDGTREYELRKADGGTVLVQVNSAVERRDGEVVRVFGFARDITPQRQAEAAARSLEKRLHQEQRVASLGRVAATVAHEFNNLLMGISAFAELMARHAGDDPKLTRAAEYTRQAIRRGKRVTDEVLRFAKPVEPSAARFDVNAWLEQLRPMLEEVVGSTIEVRLDAAAEPLPVVGDAAQLEQVLINLAINARDAMAAGGALTITTRRAKEAVHIRIRDEGAGIPPELIDSIFDPLFTTKRAGTGLGLSVVHQIIHAHGGTITVESRVGSGTEFLLQLPMPAE